MLCNTMWSDRRRLITKTLLAFSRDGDVRSGDDEPDDGGNADNNERGAGDADIDHANCAGSDFVYIDGDENPKLIQTIRLSKRGLRPCV